MPPVARADLVAVFRDMMTAIDDDGDGRLSLAEWREATVGGGSRAGRAIPIRLSLRGSAESVFRELDGDGDQVLSFAEFAREPLANFDCLDADNDGIVQPAEGEARTTRCASVEATSPAR